MRRSPLQSDPLIREIDVGRLVGWPLVAVTLASGVGCGLLALTVDEDSLLAHSPEWLLIPAVIPVCYSVARGRSLLLGRIGGLFSAAAAFLVVGLYVVWHVACFIITFMGEC